MEIYQQFLTDNLCYKAKEYIVPTKIMLHSTAVKGAPAKNFLKSWNVPKPNDKKVCVHAFTDPGVVYQTLPWNMRGWHCAGTGNNIAIGIEICEPKDYKDKEYFLKIKQTALELCAFLCDKYRLTPADVTSHCEAYKDFGIKFASNHSDLDHWWKKYHNYTMDDFRMELYNLMHEEEKEMVYNTLDEIPEWGKDAVKKAIKSGVVKGVTKDALGLTQTEIKVLVWLDRIKSFDK